MGTRESPGGVDPSPPLWVANHWPTIEQLVTTRFTQTNEVAWRALRTIAGQDVLRVAGDITAALPAVVAMAPHAATVVVVHSATLA